MQEIINWLESKRNYHDGVQLYFKYGHDPLLVLLFKEDYSEFKKNKLEEVLAALCGKSKNQKTNPKAAKPAEKKITSKKEIKEIKEHVELISDIAGDLEGRIDTLEYDVYDRQLYNEKLEHSLDKLSSDVAIIKNAQKNAPRGWPANPDDVVKKMHDEWLPLFTEKKNLQARIYDIAKQGQTNAAKKKEACKMAHRILDLRDACMKIYFNRDHYLLHGSVPEEQALIDIPDNERVWPKTLDNWQRYLRDYRAKLKAMPQNENFKKQLEKYQWGVNKLKQLMHVV